MEAFDTPTGTHLWTDRYDGSLEDVFEPQDKVAISVAGVIAAAFSRRAQASRHRRGAPRR
jgi:TolB-like protein